MVSIDVLKKIPKFWKLIRNAKKILLINHIKMDGDALWSLLAFKKVLRKLGGKTVECVNDDLPPFSLKFILSKKEFHKSFDIKKFNPDLIISFDAADTHQLGDTYKKYKETFYEKDFIVIDHHITNPWFWDINLIDIQASSTCEITYEIIKELSFEKYIDSEIATLILTGILTDTNIFYNKNTTPKTIRTAAELLEYGADQRSIIFHLFRKKWFNKSKLWGEILRDLKQEKEWKIVWATVPKEYLEKTDTFVEDISWLTNEFLANIEWAEVGFLLYEARSWEIKASIRSNNDYIDVAKFCQTFGWGWHKLAAGFRKEGKLKDIEKEVINGLIKIVK